MKKFEKLVIAAMIFLMTTAILPASNASTKLKVQNVPTIQDPTPGYWETSEYMIGKIAVGIIFPESNGSIDVSTEDWTDFEIQQCLNKIQYALNWWSSQNPNANVSFVTEVHARVPTSYELISHNFTDIEQAYAMSEIMTYLGYPINYSNPKPYPKYQMQDYLNDLRKRLNTDWAFEIEIINAFNDSDGKYADGTGANANWGGPYLQVPVKTTDNLDYAVAHELAHIFWATDEYNGRTEYGGYLNITDIEGSGCIMDTFGSWSISGKPQGLQGTWGQIGWRDSDGDGIQDIVDTVPRVYLNQPEIMDDRLNCSGISAVTPYQNRNPYTRNPQGKRNVAINKIESVQFRVDSGDWTPATPTDGSFGGAIENFIFTTPTLSIGSHTLTIKAIDNWGSEGYANQTVTIPQVTNDIAITTLNPYRSILSNRTTVSINITAVNQGDMAETFNVTVYANTTNIGAQTVNLPNGTSTVLTFTWNTTGFAIGNYTITAVADSVLGETDTSDNSLSSTIQVSILGDINGDGRVDMKDVSKVAAGFQTHSGDTRWAANGDLDENGVIDMKDISTIAKHFGEHYP